MGRQPISSRIARPSRPSLSFARGMARIALVVPIAAMAWWFAGVRAEHQLWLFAGILVALILFLATCWRSRSALRPLPIAIVPLLLALTWCACQLLPLSASLLERVAPRNHALWTSLLPADADAEDSSPSLGRALGEPERPASYSVSLYPSSTRHDLAMLLGAVAIFFLAGQLFGRSRSWMGLSAVVALQGAAVAFFGLAQQLQWNGLLFGTVRLTEGGAPFASFVNRNSGGGYLNICLGAAMAMTVWVFARRGAARSRGLMGFLAELNMAKLAAVAAVVVVFAGVVCSLSRGAWISAAIAAIATATAIAWSHRSWFRLRWAIAVAVIGIGLVGWLGRGDLVAQRMATLWRTDAPPDSRWAHWENGLLAAADSPWMGSGLGTYRYIYRLHEQNGSPSWFYHAENQYLEALVEAGVPGLLGMLAALAAVGVACWQLLRRSPHTAGFACGVGGTFILTSQIVHAGFDFGLYLPANMSLLALLCGGLCGVAASPSRRVPRAKGVEARRRQVPSTASVWWTQLPTSRAVPAALAGLLICGTGFALGEIRGTAIAETAIRASRLEFEPDAASLGEVDRMIDDLSRACLVDPGQAEANLRLGQLWIYRYRLEAFEALEQERQEQPRATQWGWTSTVNLHRLTHELARDNPYRLDRLRQAGDVRTNLVAGARALVAARRACPLMVKPHLLLAQIGGVATEVFADEPSLRRAQLVSTGDFDSLVECGLLHAQAGRSGEAVPIWRRAITVWPDRYDRVLSLAAAQPQMAPRMSDLIPDDPELLLRVAKEYFTGDDQVESRQTLALRAAELLPGHTVTEAGRSEYLLASAFALAGQGSSAVSSYLTALQKRPEMTHWRYELAHQYEQLGQLEEAARQIALCIRSEPANEDFLALQRQLFEKRFPEGRPHHPQNRSTSHDTSANLRIGCGYRLVGWEPPSKLET